MNLKKIGIFGFNDLVEQKTKALNKFYRKQVWMCFKGFFELPKIIITLFSIWALYRLLHVLSNKIYMMMALVGVVFSVHLFHLIKFKFRVKKTFKQTGKKWLFENSLI